ncbi:transmembrane protein 216-like isoform X1 [Rhopilema esculentum]|uniref:transmembrane protein 216-like isoform X1 n=1 Tax=Rhopilema esculentum TaxID=499914 RepID=UPI0031D7914A
MNADAGNARQQGRKVVVDLSSLPLQVLMFLNVYYFIFFWVCELLLYIYKGSILPFPNQGGILALEIILLFLLAALESLRLFFGYKGNLAERKISLIYSIFLAVPVIFCQLYLILWQTYVLRIEIVICAVALVFIGFEIILSGAMIWTFQRHESFIRQ